MATSALGPDSTGGPAIQGAVLNDAGSVATQKGQDIGFSDPSGFGSEILPIHMVDHEA